MTTLSLLVLGASLAPSTALPERPSLLENLEFQAVGLVIVLGALFTMYLLCALVGRFSAPSAPARARPAAQPAPAAARGGGAGAAGSAAAARSLWSPSPPRWRCARRLAARVVRAARLGRLVAGGRRSC
jgi:hypothetical protein